MGVGERWRVGAAMGEGVLAPIMSYSGQLNWLPVEIILPSGFRMYTGKQKY